MGSNTSRVDEPPSNQEQTVTYKTSDSSGTCTLRAHVEEKGAIIVLRDYTFDKKGTGVSILLGIHHRLEDHSVDLGYFEKDKRARGLMDHHGPVNIKHWGNTLQVREKQNQQFCIAYGVPRVRCGFLIVTKDETGQHDTLSVRHLYGTAKQGFSIVVVQVWYDIRKGSYVCTLTGPSHHSWPSDIEAILAKGKAAYPSDVEHSTGTITGLTNNRWGHVFGDLNGTGPSHHSWPSDIEAILAKGKAAYPSNVEHSTGTLTGLTNNRWGHVFGDLDGSLINFITQNFLDDNGSGGSGSG